MLMRLFFICFLLFSLNASAQHDGLNKLNSKGKKDGYWIQYLDSLVNPVDSADSYFVGYNLYDNGKKVFNFSDRSSIWKKYRLVYEGRLPEKGKPILIQGKFSWYSYETRLENEEIYKDGNPLFMKSYVCGKGDTTHCFNEVLYFDKLYNNIPGTFYYEEYSDQRVVGKYWFRKGKKGWKCYRIKDQTEQ